MYIKDLWEKVFPRLKKEDVGIPTITSTPMGETNMYDYFTRRKDINSETYKKFEKPYDNDDSKIDWYDGQSRLDYWSISSHPTYRRFTIPITESRRSKLYPRGKVKRIKINNDYLGRDYYNRCESLSEMHIDSIKNSEKKKDPRNRDFEDLNYEQWSDD